MVPQARPADQGPCGKGRQEWKWSAEQDEIALKECLARGMVINDVSDEPAWTEAARSVWPQFYDKVGGKAVVEEALAIMQQ